MTPFDWTAVLLGFGIGVVASAAYFLGLALGMRAALRGTWPVRLLILSAAVRIAGLLVVGWLVLGHAGPWSLLGYAGAFWATRFSVTSFARPPLVDAS